ncbi:hypothetical protein Cgig2_020648 [Carnegiea gigantea]|uniref:Reverse transcriptase domain-containing protein n=1 Tax=Carnegiea gigantea TaxID=171969 RepID=A0A9Q1JZ23_9CARY|nr:hypothetical protein Cgig2_020648 [Carnegiea gigantea]
MKCGVSIRILRKSLPLTCILKLRARRHLEQKQLESQQHPEDKLRAQKERAARDKYISILSSSMALIKQHFKLEWIKYGDDSTRLFFAKAKQRKLSSYIYSLKDQEGRLVEGFEQVGQTMFSFYQNLLGQQHTVRLPIDMEVIAQGKVLTNEKQVHMCRPFKDIRDAIWSIPTHKSLGPDGYSSGFFESTWEQTGPLVCFVVQEFFKTTTMPKEISETKLILIPKVQNPQHATEFRPISCYNVIYKCITKLLCQRIKEILPTTIHPNQGTFVKGRELLYNVLICQDLARGYKRQRISPRCLLKIDIQKAFDSGHWRFIADMMTALKFPKIFITWVLVCISYVSFSFHTNGQNTGVFLGGRGLK